MKFSVRLVDRVFVDAGDAALHHSGRIELPVLVPIRTEPVAAVVMVFIGKSHRDSVAGMCPNLLDKAVVKFPRPFARKKRLDFGAAADELSAVAPPAVRRVGERYPRRVAAVPGIFRKPRLFGSGCVSEGR